ncbi:MAG: ABC transporter substrate-binding protein [Acetobacteraceae bacterium]|nr:ABC transporter substrate-binding protein [Acetobacteraceae bacterium]
MTGQPLFSRRRMLELAALGPLSVSTLRHGLAQSNGKTLTVAIPAGPTTLDPINAVTHDPLVVTGSIFENLVEYDQDGVLKPQLAKALPEVSADKLIYTFDLRDDVQFHNGQKMTAEDVKYSFDSMLDPQRAAARRGVFARIDKVEVDSPARVRVYLKQPYAPWVYFLTKYMGIWPKDSREKLGDEHFKLHPSGVGTGPGMFEEWRPNEYVSLRRNPNYWQQGLPRWEKLVVKIVPEDATRVAYLMTGQADIIGAPPPRDFARLKSQRGITGAQRPTLGGWSVMLCNTARPPFDDVNFRKAIAYGVDRETIAKDVFFGLVHPATVPAPPGSWWYDEKADHVVRYDPEQARAYLAKSKYPNGAEFDVSVPATPYLLDMKDAAVVVQAQLQKLGIKPNIKLQEPNVVVQSYIRGEHHATMANIMSPGEATYLIMVNFMQDQVMTRTSNYSNPRIDQLMTKIFADSDGEKLKPLFSQLMTIFAEEQPYIWLGFFDVSNLWRDSVKNFKVNQGLSLMVRDVVPT